MIYIFIICIFFLLIFCLFSQKQSKKIIDIQESFENKKEEINSENAKMGKEWGREIKDSTFNTNMPSQITYENILSFPNAEIKLEPMAIQKQLVVAVLLLNFMLLVD